MRSLPPDFYESWCHRNTPASGVVHDGGALPPERWLQQIWRHQRLRRGELTGWDGRPVRVLHPGFWNRGPGPDFQRAVIQLGDEPAVSGDVEIDLGVGGWRSHGHDRNDRYGQVILHVVWDSPTLDLQPPVLALKPFLDAPLTELGAWLEEEASSVLPAETRGQCCAPLAAVDAATLAELLTQAARVRLKRKAGELAIRARQVGWEQSLWEGLFAALGYRHNTWPMRRLAELAEEVAGKMGTSVLPAAADPNWEARFLGLAGLLPAQLPRGDNMAFAKSLWDAWWRERDAWENLILPPEAWQFAGLRPANHPQRRLVLAARWWSAGDLPRRIEEWLGAMSGNTSHLAAQLLTALSPRNGADDFWAHHWTLRSPRLAQPVPLLGAARVTDLALNVILPWLHARATTGGNDPIRTEVERRHFAWPAGEDNGVLKLARTRLFGGTTRKLPRTAAAQQGLLQISRDFCDRADALCTGCRFPELVRALRAA